MRVRLLGKELSASALQIEEKRERKDLMMSLAEELTLEQIGEYKKAYPNASRDSVIAHLKALGIPRREFVNEYICNIGKGSSVAKDTALGYYREERDRLRPRFIEFLKKNKPFFHLNENTLSMLCTEEKETKPK